MDRYVKGLLTAYDRVLNLINLLDPDGKDNSLECIKARICASVYAYKMFIKDEDLAKVEKESTELKNLNLDNALDLSDINTGNYPEVDNTAKLI